jgi:hypothetical protein
MVSHTSFARAPPDLLPRHPGDYRASPTIAGLPLSRQPCIRFLFVGSGLIVVGFLQIPPRDGHPCLDGRFRSPRSAEDFHLQNV